MKTFFFFFCEWYDGNKAYFPRLAAVNQTCSAPCPPLTCTCSLMSWRRRWRGAPLLLSEGRPLPLQRYLTVTSLQPHSPPHPRRRCSQCSRTHLTAMNAGTPARCLLVKQEAKCFSPLIPEPLLHKALGYFSKAYLSFQIDFLPSWEPFVSAHFSTVYTSTCSDLNIVWKNRHHSLNVNICQSNILLW